MQYNIFLLQFQIQMQTKGTKISIQQDLMINQITPLKVNKKAHTNSIQSLAAHPDQRTFATGSHDKSIKIWDADTFKESMSLVDHKDGVWALDYNRDGSLLSSGGPDKTVLIWDSKKSSPGIKITSHSSKVYATKFNETGKLLGTCGENGEVFIWDLANTKQPLKKIQIKSLIAYDIQWSKNEQNFFVTTFGSKVYGYQSKFFKQICENYVTPNAEQSKSECVSANFKILNKRVYCGSHRGVIAWFQFSNNQLIKQAEFVASLDSVRKIVYHPQEEFMVSTGRDGSAKLWNISSQTHHPTLLGNLALHSENIPGAAFLNTYTFITGSWDQKLAIWNIKSLIK